MDKASEGQTVSNEPLFRSGECRDQRFSQHSCLWGSAYPRARVTRMAAVAVSNEPAIRIELILVRPLDASLSSSRTGSLAA
jgi:hypothetical protein